ncbi:hypothetical protein B0H10DRAFT_2241122 [Mycena sp. CBHHK59/15]|nr:hypothetical protein B0H10DRAFT_2241122 [Mycena sp. CBHHK59/15]
MTTMNATDAVRQNAPYYTRLLGSIEELDYVPPALAQQTSYVAGLEAQLKVAVRKIAVLARKTQKERREHEDLRDSTARRLAAKLTGRKEKFEAKASKEEREYVEALEKEMQERSCQTVLETMIKEGKAVRDDLTDKAAVYQTLKEDLAQLYSKIFDGPTQAYPEDDRLEYQLQLAQTRHDQIQGCLNQESQALNLLGSANAALGACSTKVKEALNYSQWDMFGGGAMTDMMERNALSAAEALALQAATYVQQAQFASGAVQPIGEISIAHGSIMSDVIFDNIFTDMAFHDKIKRSARNIAAVQLNLTRELTNASARTGAAGAELSAAADALARCRAELDGYRKSIFDSLAGGVPPPPAYTPPPSPPPGRPDAQIVMPTPDAPRYAAPPVADSNVASETQFAAAPSTAAPSAAWGNRNPYAAALADSAKS